MQVGAIIDDGPRRLREKETLLECINLFLLAKNEKEEICNRFFDSKKMIEASK